MQGNTTARCTDCGRQLTSRAGLSGLCPHCLVSLALADSEAEEASTLARGAVPETGEILGERYEIRSRLGRGGQGEVFRAFDVKLRVDVALKALRAELVRNEQGLEFLRGEVRSAREVVSPHVCRVFDLVVEDGLELVSMEYVDGTTLAEILKNRGPLELSEAREIASQFLSGLEAIHAAGLVHRDVKPENVMVTRSGRVVVMDFGIAKALTRDTSSGTIAGTPGYMAPEQARGESVDARADVFSAGVVLAEMTSGAKDRAGRQELWRSVRESPPKVPETAWAPVLERALSWDRKARYASARDLARALEEITLRLPGVEERSPYPGLASFTEEDKEFFFGRELDVEALWKKLKRPHLLGLIGPSGAGKSSFLRAGLLTALPEGWTHVLVKPGSRPFHALARALVPHFSGENDAVEHLLRFEDGDTAIPLVKRWRERQAQAMVVVDQFEELFTLNPPEVQRSFAELLGRLALEADVHVLLSMRDDFLFHCQSHEALAPIFSELTPLGTLSESAMRRALIQPAIACGYRFEDESLVDEMVSEFDSERGALPLLAFAASKLWERRDRQRGLLTREAYEHIGGVGGSLAQHAEATLEQIGRERVPIVRELFRNLVTAQRTRAAREREELLGLFEGEERDAASEVLDRLVDVRLLTSYELPGHESETHSIEIVHESLLSAWPRLVHWQTQDAEGAQLRDELRQAAQMWEQRNRSEDVLWTGSAFQEFQLWRQRYPGSLTPVEEAFGQAMAGRAARRKRNRRLAVTAAFAVLMAVLGVVGGLWRNSVSEALRAEASKLVALGQLELETDHTVSVAYALKSLELADTDEARLFALKSLQRAPAAFLLSTPVEERLGAQALAFSRDGQWLAWIADKQIFVQSRGGGSPILLGEYPTPDRLALEGVSVAFGPRGEYLMTEQSGDVRIWDLVRRKEIRREMLEAGTSVWPGGKGFLTDTLFERRGVIREWPPDGRDPEILGRFQRPGALDKNGNWWVHRSGPRIYVQSMREPDEPPRLFAEHARDFRWVEFHPNGEQVVTIDRSDDVHLWSIEAAAKNPIRQLPGKALEAIWFDPRGTKLVSAGRMDGRSAHYVWDLTGPPDAEPLLLGRDAPSESQARFDPTAQWVAVAHGNDIAFWPLADTYPRVHVRRDGEILTLAFTPDGRGLIVPSEDGVRLLPLTGGEGERSRILWESDSNSIEVDPTGRNALIAAGRRVELVPIQGGPKRELGRYQWVFDVAFSPSGRLAAATEVRRGDSEFVNFVRVWDLETGAAQVLGPLTDDVVNSVTFLKENEIAVAGGVAGLHHANLEDGTFETWVREERVSFRNIAASRDASFFVSVRISVATHNYGELVRFDIEDETLRTLTSHGTEVASVALDASSSLVATGSVDGVIRIGPVDEHEEAHLLLGHRGRVEKVAFSPDGRFLASASADGTARVWRVPQGTPFQRLPYEEILRRLRSVTNVRVIEDDTSSTGYSIALDPFPGWEIVPQWSAPMEAN